MIVKIRVEQRPHAMGGEGGWTFIDGIQRVDTHGPLMRDDGEGPIRAAFTREGLIEAVDARFGPGRDRSFEFEVWPQDMTDGWAKYADLAVCRRSDDRHVLVVMTSEAFLLDDSGNTIERLR